MSQSPNHDALTKLADAWYRRQGDRFPTWASQIGKSEYDGRLEAPDAGLHESTLTDAVDTRKALSAIPSPAPGAPFHERLDRKEFEAQLDLAILNIGTIRNWRKNPAEPADTVITSLFYLLMRRDLAKKETAEAIISRVEKLPAYLDAARSRVVEPVALWVDVGIEAAEGGASFLADLAAGLKEKHPSLASRLDKAIAAAGPALEKYGAALQSLKGKTLTADPAIGRAAMADMIRLNHGLSESVEEVRAIGRAQMASLKARQVEVARQIDPNATPSEIIARENRRYAETNPDMLAEYRRVTFELRDRLVSENILEMPPGESCDVISTPGFLRPMLPTAAYSSPGPLDPVQRGIFYVSDPPRSLPREEYLANVGQHYPIDPTCAHEAYPGHHAQLCWANQATSLIRKLADHIIFMEGWTLYCEQLMVELGWYPSKVYELGYLNDQLWRACRIVIDSSIHTGDMTIDDAVAMLQHEVGFTPMRARTELNWYTQSPGTPMSYLLGKGKTLSLRDSWRAKNPGGSLKDFHRWLLSHGSIPQGWLAEAV